MFSPISNVIDPRCLGCCCSSGSIPSASKVGWPIMLWDFHDFEAHKKFKPNPKEKGRSHFVSSQQQHKCVHSQFTRHLYRHSKTSANLSKSWTSTSICRWIKYNKKKEWFAGSSVWVGDQEKEMAPSKETELSQTKKKVDLSTGYRQRWWDYFFPDHISGLSNWKPIHLVSVNSVRGQDYSFQFYFFKDSFPSDLCFFFSPVLLYCSSLAVCFHLLLFWLFRTSFVWQSWTNGRRARWPSGRVLEKMENVQRPLFRPVCHILAHILLFSTNSTQVFFFPRILRWPKVLEGLFSRISFSLILSIVGRHESSRDLHGPCRSRFCRRDEAVFQVDQLFPDSHIYIYKYRYLKERDYLSIWQVVVMVIGYLHRRTSLKVHILDVWHSTNTSIFYYWHFASFKILIGFITSIVSSRL